MSKSRDEPPYELENQFILRLPPEHAATVRRMIRSGSAAMKDKLKIDLSPDGRHAVVEVDDVALSGKLVDLPCVIGSLKTFDRKTFYQTADICQMLVCSAEGDPRSSPERAAAKGDGDPEKKYLWKHGITPPMKNVRKKRFRKPRKKAPDAKQGRDGGGEPMDSPEVLKEVKRLLCSDAEAISCRWEVVADDEPKAAQGQACVLPDVSRCRISADDDPPPRAPADSGGRDDGDDDDGEEKDDPDKDDDEDAEEEEEKGGDSEEDLERELQAKIIECSLSEDKEGYGAVVAGIQKLLRHKEKKLQEIRGKAQRQKDLLKQVENLTLKSHFRSALKQLKVQKKEKHEQIVFLQEQLKYYSKK